MKTKAKWCVRDLDTARCRELADALNFPQPLVAAMMHRGLTHRDRIHSFLHPSLADLPAPFLMKGMEKAVAILAEAVARHRPVAVYGDYDVDGLTGSALLMLFFQELGLEVRGYHPNRLTDGYGLHTDKLVAMKSDIGAGAEAVLVTVDCGISDHEAICFAGQQGFSTIIADHHKPARTLPPADAVLNPLQPGCAFPFKGLAGVGVAFYLVMGLRAHLAENGFWQGQNPPNLKKYLDLVALGTVADMAPLLGVNRVFVKAGLEVMRASCRPGLRSLAAVSGIDPKAMRADDIAFRLGPRLNAVGRIGEPGKAFALLIADAPAGTQELAATLDRANETRKALGDQVYREARLKALAAEENDETALIFTEKSWHQGVLGIAASRIMKEFARPTLLFTLKNGLAKGSGRSIPDLDMHAVVSDCADLLASSGGHAAAVGVTVRRENLAELSDRFKAETAKRLAGLDLRPRLWLDWQDKDGGMLGSDFLKYYTLLAPFGVGNSAPIFSARGNPRNLRLVGRDHLKFLWPMNGAWFEAIGFGFGPALEKIRQAGRLEMVFCLQTNSFQGKASWQLQLKDLRIISV